MHQRFDESLEELRESHSPEAIRERLAEGHDDLRAAASVRRIDR